MTAHIHTAAQRGFSNAAQTYARGRPEYPADLLPWLAHDLALEAGGQLGLVWNVRDGSVDWVKAITDIITPYEGDTPRFYKGDWRTPFTGRTFAPLKQRMFSYQHVGTAQEVILDRFLSVSFIATLAPNENAQVAEQLRALIASHPALRERDSIAFPYRTEVYWCTRL